MASSKPLRSSACSSTVAKSDGRRVLQGTRYLKISLANAVFVQASRNTALRTEPPPDCKTLFCRNLAYGVDEAALAKFVKGAGVTPIEVRIPKDWHTARSKITQQSPSAL